MRNYFAALLTVLVAIPIAGATGYVLKQDPAPPKFEQYLLAQEGLKPIKSLRDEEYLFNPTKGVYKDQAVNALSEIMDTPGHLKSVGVLKWEWIKRTCDYYSPSGSDKVIFPAKVVIHCTNERVTKAEVLEYAKSLLPPSAKS